MFKAYISFQDRTRIEFAHDDYSILQFKIAQMIDAREEEERSRIQIFQIFEDYDLVCQVEGSEIYCD